MAGRAPAAASDYLYCEQQRELQKGVEVKLCPHCQEENYSDANFCRSCRAPITDIPLVKVCPYCHMESPSDANFCKYCQASIAEVRPSGSAQTERPPSQAGASVGDDDDRGDELDWNPGDYVATPISAGGSAWSGSQAVGVPAVGGRCPRCGSSQIQIVSEGETQGFGAGKGCLGAFLLGPIGFLCGLCGMGKGETRAVRMCVNCGNRF